MLDYFAMISVFFLPLISRILKVRDEFWVYLSGVVMLFSYAAIREVMSSEPDVDFAFLLSCVVVFSGCFCVFY
jgi:hypothetical protein